MSELDFLDGADAPQADTPAPEAEPAPQAQPEPAAPVRDEQGRFAPKEPAQPEPTATPPALAQAQPESTPQAPQAVPPGYVPVAALQELRKEVQALKQAPAQPVQQPTPPDRYEDPDGYEQFQQAQTQGLILNTKLELSEDMAISRHGQEKVDAAKKWALSRFNTSPAYRQEVLTNRNPYEKVMQDYQRDQIASSLDMTELEQFRAWKTAQAGLTPTPQAQPAPPITPVPAPPRSLASVSSAAGQAPPDPGTSYDGLFS